jgi:large subunit ribosomal protein L24
VYKQQATMSARMRLTKVMAQMGPKKSKPNLVQAAEKKKWNILRGDKVQVIDANHKEKGKQGIVLKVLRDLDRVIVEGVNMAPKHIKGNSDRGISGRTVQKERTLPHASVNLVDPVTNKPTRVFRKILDDGTKVRVSKKSGAVIPRPDVLTMRRRPYNQSVTDSCTSEEDAWVITWVPK